MTDASSDLSLHHELEKQAGFLRTVARRLVVGDQVDDVAQTVCLEALRARPETEGGLKGWLALVTRRLAGKARREAGRRSVRERSAARPEIIDFPRHGDASDALQLVSGAVARLDEPYRSTILALYYRGTSAEDLGRELGLPAATIRTRHRRALEMLRGKLDREFGGDRAAWYLTLLPLLPKKIAALVTSATTPLTTTSTTTAAGGALKGGFAIAASLLVAVTGIFFAANDNGLDDVALDDGSALLSPVDLERPIAPRRGIVGGRFASAAAAARNERRAMSGAAFETGSLRVHAIDGLTKAALPGIRLWAGGVDAAQGAAPLEAFTDEHGDALFPDLTAGRYAIGFFGGAVAAVDVHAGNEAKIEITLLADDQVEGQVVDSKDAPIQGAEIVVAAADDTGVYQPAAESEPSGRFTVRGVRGRALRLLALHPAFGPSSVAVIDENGSCGGPLKLVVAATTGSITGRVVDKNGTPVPNARVYYDRDGAFRKRIVMGSEDNAEYSFRSIAAGGEHKIDVVLTAAAEPTNAGTSSMLESRVVVATADLKEEGTIAAAATSSLQAAIDAAFTSPRLPTEIEWQASARGAFVTREVSNFKSLPAGSGRDRSFEDFGSTNGIFSITSFRKNGNGPRRLSTKTDEDGRFELHGVPLGEALIAVDAKGFAPSETEVTVTKDEDPYLRIYLALPSTAKGRLVDDAGLPVAGASIRAADLRTFARSATTDANGYFAIRDLPPGRMNFEIEKRSVVETVDAGTTQSILRSSPFEIYLYDGDNDLGDRIFTPSTVGDAALFYTGIEEAQGRFEVDLLKRLAEAK